MSSNRINRLTQRNGKQANNQLHASQCIKDRLGLDTALDKPRPSLERQGKAEEVLEDDHGRETLDHKITCFVFNVSQRSVPVGNTHQLPPKDA